MVAMLMLTSLLVNHFRSAITTECKTVATFAVNVTKRVRALGIRFRYERLRVAKFRVAKKQLPELTQEFVPRKERTECLLF
jgi:hypothetical protein